MNLTSILICALLYTGLTAFANPAQAQVLTPDRKSEIEAMREGEMRKLIVHDEPSAMPDAAFYDAADQETHISGSDGSIRLVNFWATWCAPCRHEKPTLDALQQSMAGPDFSVIAIATGRNDRDAIRRFNEEHGITALDTHYDPKGLLASGTRVLGLPVTLVLNRQGQEIARLTGGADWNSDSARAIVSYLIALPTEPG